MNIVETGISGLFILEPRVFEDERGYFLETYNEEKLFPIVGKYNFVQDNESKSSKGVLRGLHYQTGEFAQAKLVRVIQGEVKDIVVDIREESPTYGKKYEIILNETNKKQFLIPRGFAHGFSVLSNTAIFSYKCDNFYNKASEGQINPLCNKLNLDWGIEDLSIVNISEKDKGGPNFGDHISSKIKIKK